MNNDRYGCYHDAEVELIDQAEFDACQRGECKGAPECVHCLEAQERAAESLGG